MYVDNVISNVFNLNKHFFLFFLSSVSLSYFILALPIRKCLIKHSCMSSSFPIAILNGTFFFSLCESSE